MSDMQAVYQHYQEEGLVLLAINSGESKAQINSFRSSRGLSFPMLYDGNQAVNKLYGVTGIPCHFFISPNGRISNIGIGRISLSELEWQVKLILMRYATPTP